MMKSYIFKKNFQYRYNKMFQDYVIHVFYGDQVLYGEDLLREENNEDNE